MSAAKAEAPEFIAEVEIDMSGVRDLRTALRGAGDHVPSFNDFVIKASAAALRQVPKLNASFSPEAFVLHDRVNIGVAVAANDALVVPTIFDADHKTIAEISADVRELAAKVRDGAIRAEELAGQTFTVSNLGMYGLPRFTAIINPPQAAILAVGAVEERVVVVDGAPATAPQMTATLTSDHRVVYGADAAEFLAALKSGLEEPAQLDEQTNDFVAAG